MKSYINKTSVLILSSVAIFAIFMLFPKSKSSESKVNDISRLTHSEYKSQAKELLKVGPSSPKNPEAKVSEKHVRKYPLYEISRSDYALLSLSLTDLDKLKSAIATIRSSHKEIEAEESHFYNSEYWDLNKTPQNNKEYSAFIVENRIQILRKISEGIKAGDAGEVQIHVAAMEVINFFSAFELVGFDKKNTPVAVLKEKVFAMMQKNQIQKKLDKSTPFTNPKRGVANSGDSAQSASEASTLETEVRDFREEALSLLESTNPVFFADYNNKSLVDKFYLEEDEVTDGLTNIFTTLAEYISSLEFLPEGMQISERDTLAHLKDIFLDAKSHPDYYNAKNLSIETIPDLPFSVYSKSIEARRAMTAALYAASITVAGDVVSKFLVSIRLFTATVLTFFPPESLLSGYHCYHGSKELYKTHLLHSELVKQKDFYESKDRRAEFVRHADDISERAAKAVKSTHIDEIMRGQINQAWAWGFIMGYTRVGIHRGSQLVRGIMRSIRTDIVGKRTSNLALQVMQNAQIGKAAKAASGGWFTKNSAKILGLASIDTSKLGFIGRIIDNPLFKEASSLLKANGPGLALVAADGLISGAISYQLVFNRLNIFSNFIGKIYLSPESSIALVANDNREGVDFFRESLKYFAPVCNYFAYYEVSDQSYDPNNPSVKQDQAYIATQNERKLKCLKLLNIFNGGELNLRQTMQQIEVASTQMSAGRLTEAYYGDKPIVRPEASKALALMTYFPSHYKVIWLSALRAIYPAKDIPQSYYTVRNLVIHETENPDGFFGLSNNLIRPDQAFDFAATRKNLSNMNYLIDYFANLLCKEKNADDTSLCLDGENVNLVYAYELIWEKSVEKAVTARAELAAYESSKDDRWWFEAIFDGMVEGFQTFMWSVKKGFSSPAKVDFEFQVPEYLEELRQQEKLSTNEASRKESGAQGRRRRRNGS